MIPFLFIPDHGRSQPVLQVTARNVTFIWDEKLKVHVHRFESIDDFNTRAPELIKEERTFKLLPGIEGPDEINLAGKTDEDLHQILENLDLQISACTSLADGEEINLQECSDVVRNSSAVKEMARLCALREAVDQELEKQPSNQDATDETTTQPEAPIEVDPQGGNPPADPPPGPQTPDPIPGVTPTLLGDTAPLLDNGLYNQALAEAAAKPKPEDSPIFSGETMTTSEAAATLGNGKPEPEDPQAAQILAAAKKHKKKAK